MHLNHCPLPLKLLYVLYMSILGGGGGSTCCDFNDCNNYNENVCFKDVQNEAGAFPVFSLQESGEFL